MTRAYCMCLVVGAFLLTAVTQQSRAEDLDVTLECSADFYTVGDSVFFTWTNGTDSTLVAAYHPPYEIYDETTGQLIYAGELPMEFYLGPNEVALLDWDQLDHFDEQVPPGVYRVHITFVIYEHIPPPPWFGVEDCFRILGASSVEDDNAAVSETSWGRIKQRHR